MHKTLVIQSQASLTLLYEVKTKLRFLCVRDRKPCTPSAVWLVTKQTFIRSVLNVTPSFFAPQREGLTVNKIDLSLFLRKSQLARKLDIAGLSAKETYLSMFLTKCQSARVPERSPTQG